MWSEDGRIYYILGKSHLHRWASQQADAFGLRLLRDGVERWFALGEWSRWRKTQGNYQGREITEEKHIVESYLGSSKTREFEGSFCYRRLGKFTVLFLAHSWPPQEIDTHRQYYQRHQGARVRRSRLGLGVPGHWGRRGGHAGWSQELRSPDARAEKSTERLGRRAESKGWIRSVFRRSCGTLGIEAR